MASDMMCRNCKTDISVLINFGMQPPSNRFLANGEPDSDRHPLVLGQCQACGLIQLINPMPADMARPRYQWLKHNEPEGHLDALCNVLSRLQARTVCGLSYKDDSTLDRLRVSGFKDGRDVVIARHILEHAHDPKAFLAGLVEKVNPNGYLVIEVPDSSKFLESCDYSFVWEEHILYFTEETLRTFLSEYSVEIIRYRYEREDSLVAIVRPDKRSGIGNELTRGRNFAERFNKIKRERQEELRRLRELGKRIAVFGAGHQAAKFVNLLELGEFIDCVIDDNPNKQNMTMPGSGLPVLGSEVLPDTDMCFLALGPDSEKKVMARDYAGEFRSIWPT